jgi:hypothetical protein
VIIQISKAKSRPKRQTELRKLRNEQFNDRSSTDENKYITVETSFKIYKNSTFIQ